MTTRFRIIAKATCEEGSSERKFVVFVNEVSDNKHLVTMGELFDAVETQYNSNNKGNWYRLASLATEDGFDIITSSSSSSLRDEPWTQLLGIPANYGCWYPEPLRASFSKKDDNYNNSNVSATVTTGATNEMPAAYNDLSTCNDSNKYQHQLLQQDHGSNKRGHDECEGYASDEEDAANKSSTATATATATTSQSNKKKKKKQVTMIVEKDTAAATITAAAADSKSSSFNATKMLLLQHQQQLNRIQMDKVQQQQQQHRSPSPLLHLGVGGNGNSISSFIIDDSQNASYIDSCIDRDTDSGSDTDIVSYIDASLGMSTQCPIVLDSSPTMSPLVAPMTSIIDHINKANRSSSSLATTTTTTNPGTTTRSGLRTNTTTNTTASTILYTEDGDVAAAAAAAAADNGTPNQKTTTTTTAAATTATTTASGGGGSSSSKKKTTPFTQSKTITPSWPTRAPKNKKYTTFTTTTTATANKNNNNSNSIKKKPNNNNNNMVG